MKRVIFLLVMSVPLALWAAPAPWYKWHSPMGDYDICSQTPPGSGWVVVKGPFKDSHCQKPGLPGG